MSRSVLVVVGLFVWLAPLAAKAQSDIPPLPDRNPLRTGAPAQVEAPPLTPGEYPSVPWTEAEVTAATAACKELLGAVTIDYQPLPPINEGLCGAPAPILVSSVGKDPKVEIKPPATMTCPLARALSDWLNNAVQPEAKTLLGAQVVGLRNATSYACRNRYGGAKTPLSEHALANALDVAEFTLASGEHVTVLDSWPKTAAPSPVPEPKPERSESTAGTEPAKTATASEKKPSPQKHGGVISSAQAEPAPEADKPPVEDPPKPDPKGQFLKLIHDKACQRFGTTLGPEANAAHKNHFHLDQKKRRSGFCE
jgi:hypothetical protein